MARKSIAPWSERVAEGLIDQPIDSSLVAGQTLRPTVDTGFIDQSGTWKGNVSSDTEFKYYQKDSSIAHTASFITAFGLDMTGFKDIQFALRTTATGNYALEAVMGSDGSQSYANLSPLNDATILKGTMAQTIPVDIESLFGDGSVVMTQDVWNIFYIGSTLRNQKLLQFKITNNSGSQVDVETTFLRIV